MDFLSLFGQMIIYFVVLTIFYFSFDKLMQSKLYLNFRIPKQLNDLIFGFFLGLVNLMSAYSLSEIGAFGKVPIYLFLSLILVFFKSYQSALYSLAPLLLYHSIRFEIDEIFYTNVGLTFGVILVIQILNNFLPWATKSLGVVGVIMSEVLISLGLNLWFFETNTIYYNSLINTFSLALYLLFFFCFYYLMNFSISSNLLYASSNFTFMRYYRPGIAKSTIARFARVQKIKYAALNVFELDFPPQKNNSANKEIRLSVLEAISKLVPKNAVLFNLIGNTYGFFLPYNHNSINIQAYTKNLISKIPQKHRLPWKEIVEVKIKMGIAIYGVHNYNINTLFNYAIFALNTMSDRSDFSFFNPKLWLQNEKETKLINQLDDALYLDGFTNNFTNLWAVKDAKKFGYWIAQDNISQYSLDQNIEDIVYYQNWQNVFYRYFANEAIKLVKNYPICFHYDLSIFEQDFDVENFAYQLRKEKVKLQNIFFVISPYAYQKVKNPQKVKKIIAQLEAIKVNFIVSNDAPKEAQKFFSKIKYSYVYKDFEKKHFPNSILISPIITNWDMLKYHLEKGVDIIGGPLFVRKNIVTKFDKQSKIYLEKVLGRLKNE